MQEIRTFLDAIREFARDYKVVAEPEMDEKDWWAGAPSVAVIPPNNGSDGPTFLMAIRMREPHSPRGRRGYAIHIFKSYDGFNFNPVKKIHRDDMGVPVFERPAILYNPITEKIQLFGCSASEGGWIIWKLDDVEDPVEFDPKTKKIVLSAAPAKESDIPDGNTDIDGSHHEYTRILGYKDPFLIWLKNPLTGEREFHMFVIGYDKVERPYHFISLNDEGTEWKPYGANDPIPIMDNCGWHNFFTRPSCLIPLSMGYILVYEGSNVHDYDPTYNISTGLAFTPDLKKFFDLTPDKPLLKSTTPCRYHTWRYSHWITMPDHFLVYFEACRSNQSNETRVAKIPRWDLV